MNVNSFLQSLNDGTIEGEFGKIEGRIQNLIETSAAIRADILLKPYWALEAWF